MRNLLLTGLLAATLSGCAMMGPPAPVKLRAADSGKTVTLSPKQALTLDLVSNATTGYRWTWANPVNPVLAKAGEPVYTPSQSARDGMVGAGGIETWTFRPTAYGETTLRMEYRRPWGTQTPAEKVLTYTVKVEK
ncbi:protease inhibitor I42 family protein [Solimonas sp. K1W22B-7]|uniref:protease inhibitor I42 family protein n=1 Tax=Solimonas sp. K1W22B-7 TaxID=2303331 RepID=UPI0013C406B4|nr:protease inhibitor I42 family protein [Solimonas sp. K1W22B-7]